MTARGSAGSGRADVAALVLALLLAAGASAPDLALRAGEGWRRCREDVLSRPAPPSNAVEPPERERLGRALARAEGLRAAVATAVFRPDPTRVLAPLPAPGAPGPARVENLDGRVAEGRLSLRWKPAGGSRATLIRLEGLGGPGVVEREVPSPGAALQVPVPGAAGRIVVRAVPVGAAGTATEARVSIPFRVPVEVVRAERASPDSGSAILVLRRPYDASLVEGEFPLHEADNVGGLSAAGPGGPPVEFLTDYVLDEVRARPGEEYAAVPEFGPDGRVARDRSGRPLVSGRTASRAGVEVVLRGINEERLVLEAR